MRTLSHPAGSRAETEWHDALARAVVTVQATTYAIADALTHAPITPYAPLPGAVGIRADVARAHPGLTALPLADVHPDARRRFADTVDSLANADETAAGDTLARSVEWALTAARPETRPYDAERAAHAADNLTRRAHRLMQDAVTRRARAAAIRATLPADNRRP